MFLQIIATVSSWVDHGLMKMGFVHGPSLQPSLRRPVDRSQSEEQDQMLEGIGKHKRMVHMDPI